MVDIATPERVREAIQETRQCPPCGLTTPKEAEWWNDLGPEWRLCPLQVFGEVLGIPRFDVNQFAIQFASGIPAVYIERLMEAYHGASSPEVGLAGVCAGLELYLDHTEATP